MNINEATSDNIDGEQPTATSAPNDQNKFWNISNDEHYNPKSMVQEAAVAAAATSTKHVSTALTLQHTQAALELHQYYFPTHLSSSKLRNFHRYPLDRLANERLLSAVRSVLRKFIPTVEKPQFQLNFSSEFFILSPFQQHISFGT